jgi:hypothetical protein
MSKRSRHKAGVIFPFGIFIFNMLPYGLQNAPEFFTKIMYFLLGLLWFVRVYIDDITVFSRNAREHLEHLRIVFGILKENGVKLNPDKCFFFRREIKLLGHIIDTIGIKMDPEKMAAIINRKPPTNVKQMQEFLGLTNYYRKFIKDYSKIAAPLHKLTATSTKWNWDKDCQEAFDTLKVKVTTYPILRSPDFRKPFILHSDASCVALAGVLCQNDDNGNEYVIHYGSKLLKPAERKYSIVELECLALVFFINFFRIYLAFRKFKVFTDNEAVSWLKNLTNPGARLSRWSILLSQYDFEVVHR